MYERVVKSRVEHLFLFLRAAFDNDAAEVVVPLAACVGAYRGEILPVGFGLEVEARVLD
jgi:hypothetical protein